MNDTIVLRLHNIKSKYETVLQFVRSCGRTSSFKGEFDASNIEKFNEKQKLLKTKILGMVYGDSGNFLPLSFTTSFPAGSFSYGLYARYDVANDFIEFNFSIPKYLYGNNVMQFINYYSQDYQTQFSYLIGFVENFFRMETIFPVLIDLYDVEINRVDICYNQFFPSKEDALKYLELQKVRMKKFKNNIYNPSPLETGVVLKTDRWNFKIYHKGTEFQKHDYLKLQKTNKVYDLNFLKETADRILRYELTCRRSFFNYLFERMYYTKVTSHKDSITCKNHYYYMFRTMKIDGDLKQVDSKAKEKFKGHGFKETDKRQGIHMKKFFLKSNYDHVNDLRQSGETEWLKGFRHDYNVTFDINLYRELDKTFWRWCKAFQIDNSVSIIDIKRKIEVYEKSQLLKLEQSGKKKMGVNDARLMFYVRLTQQESLKDYYKAGHISARTYYRVLKILNELGLSEYNPDCETVKPVMDFSEYKYYFGKFHLDGK